MSKAYLIDKKTKRLITEVNTNLPTGMVVLCGYDTETVDGDLIRSERLLEAFPAKLVRDKRYQLQYDFNMPSATEINPGEFLLTK